MTPTDEAALKAGSPQIKLIDAAFTFARSFGTGHPGEDQSHRQALCEAAIAFAQSQRSQPVAVVPAEQAEDSAMLDWLDKNNARFQMGWRVGIAPAGNASIQSVIQLGGQPLTSIRAAIRAAIGRNREAGGS